jgi:hypothetical protein
MSDALLSKLDDVERRRDDLLARLSALDDETLRARPADDKWSLLEIAEHLVLVEPAVMGDLSDPEGAASGSAGTRGMSNRIKYGLVLFILRFGIPVKTPSRKMNPSGERSLDDLKRTWRGQHDELRAFLNALPPGGEDLPLFRHPVTGPITVAEGVRMLSVHLDTHLRQVDRRLTP